MRMDIIVYYSFSDTIIFYSSRNSLVLSSTLLPVPSPLLHFFCILLNKLLSCASHLMLYRVGNSLRPLPRSSDTQLLFILSVWFGIVDLFCSTTWCRQPCTKRDVMRKEERETVRERQWEIESERESERERERERDSERETMRDREWKRKGERERETEGGGEFIIQCCRLPNFKAIYHCIFSIYLINRTHWGRDRTRLVRVLIWQCATSGSDMIKHTICVEGGGESIQNLINRKIRLSWLSILYCVVLYCVLIIAAL